MARKKTPPKSTFDLVYASPALIRETKAEIAELEKMLREDKAGIYGKPKIHDLAEFNKVLKQKHDIINNHSPIKLKGQKANQAYNRVKELAEKIKAKLPPKSDMHPVYPRSKDPVGREFDFERAVNRQMAFQTDPVLKSMIREYQATMASLDPDDPTVRNIERLRG